MDTFNELLSDFMEQQVIVQSLLDSEEKEAALHAKVN